MPKATTTVTQMSLINQLPTFSGSSEENIQFFLNQIQEVADLEKWDEKKKFLILKLNCKEKALKFISTDNNALKAMNFGELKNALISKFATHETFAEIQQQFNTINQKPNQSVKQLAETVDHLANKYLKITENSNSQLLEVAEQIKLNKFTEALRSDIRIEVKKSNPKSFSEATKIATNIETALADPEYHVNSMSSEFSFYLAKQAETNQAIQALSQKLEEMCKKDKHDYLSTNNNDPQSSKTIEMLPTENKNQLHCLICGKRHLTIKCWHYSKINRHNKSRNFQSRYKQDQSNTNYYNNRYKKFKQNKNENLN